MVVFCDRGAAYSGQAMYQAGRMAGLSAAGCEVNTAKGISRKKVYEENGRDSADFQGILHSKSMIVKSPDGDYAIMGSANWTVSSKANLETSLLVRLRAPGLSQCLAQVAILRDHSAVFEAPDAEQADAARREKIRRAAERRLSRSLSRTSTR